MKKPAKGRQRLDEGYSTTDSFMVFSAPFSSIWEMAPRAKTMSESVVE